MATTGMIAITMVPMVWTTIGIRIFEANEMAIWDERVTAIAATTDCDFQGHW